MDKHVLPIHVSDNSWSSSRFYLLAASSHYCFTFQCFPPVASLFGCADRVCELADLVDLYCHNLSCLEPSLRRESQADAKRGPLQ